MTSTTLTEWQAAIADGMRRWNEAGRPETPSCARYIQFGFWRLIERECASAAGDIGAARASSRTLQ